MLHAARNVVALPAGRTAKWIVVAVWLALLLGAVPLAGRLSEVTADSATVEMPRGGEATRVAELARRFPDARVSVGILVYERRGGVTATDRSAVAAVRAAAVPLATGPIAVPAPSGDGAALMLAVPLAKEDGGGVPNAARLRTLARTGLPPGLLAYLTGPAGGSLDARDGNERTNALVALVTIGVIAVLLLLIYRSPMLWLLPLIAVAVAAVMIRAVEYVLGSCAGMSVDAGNATVVTVLVFGVGTDYALLLLARYREELRRRPDRHDAMAHALRGAAPAIVASAATVALSLLCLTAADMGFNHALGAAGALAIVGTLAATTTLLPAMLVILGRWVFWPLVPRPGQATPTRASLWERIGRGVGTRPGPVWVVAVLALGALALGALGLRTGLSDQDRVAGTPQSVTGQQALAAHYPAGGSRPVQVIAAAGSGGAVRAVLLAVPGVASVTGPHLSTDGGLVRLDAVLSAAGDSAAAESAVTRIRAAVHALPGAAALVGGAGAQRMEQAAAQAHDRRTVIPLMLVVVLVVLGLLLRSLVAPVLVLATVVLSYTAALGGSWLLFDHVFGFPAVDTQLALVGFIFLVALGVDYTIFLLSRVREEVARRGHRAGVLGGLVATGGVITGAGAVLAATFAALWLSPLVAFKEIGVLVALRVALDASLVRSVMLPALALAVGPRFWWPGDPAGAASRQVGARSAGSGPGEPADGVGDQHVAGDGDRPSPALR